MFTGMIREVGTVRAVRRRGEGATLEVASAKVAAEAAVGDSIAVEGSCLTAETVGPGGFTAFLSGETLARTTLGRLSVGARVNLEPSLRLSDKLGGHLVQGHVEGLAEVVQVRPTGEGCTLGVCVPEALVPFLAPKGSLALSGVSLTVAALTGPRVDVAVVPLTLRETTLGDTRPGDRLNLETDLVARHVVAWLQSGRGGPVRTLEELQRMGF